MYFFYDYLYETIFSFQGILIYSIYLLLVTTITFIAALNARKLQAKLKFDILIYYIMLYLSNSAITYFHFIQINIIFRMAFSTILLTYIAGIAGKIHIIGLTGDIGSGKSQVGRHFMTQTTIKVIDCEILLKKLIFPNSPVYTQLFNTFGERILNANREIKIEDLNRMRNGDKQKRDKIIHAQLVWEIIKEVYRLLFKEKRLMCVLQGPIFEIKYLKFFCYPICIVHVSDESVQIRRVALRDGISEEEAVQKINQQPPIDTSRADILLLNNGSLEDLKNQIMKEYYNFLF